MSLELAIQQNTEAIHSLVALLKSGAAPAPLVGAAKDVIVKAPKAQAEPVQPEPVQAAAEVEQKAQLRYEDISKPFVQLVNLKGRDVAQQLLNDLGLPTGKKLSALAESDYPKALDAILKAIG